MMSMAEAPSVICEELPAVIDQEISGNRAAISAFSNAASTRQAPLWWWSAGWTRPVGKRPPE